MTIPVYPAEANAGLTELIQAKSSIAFDMGFEISNRKEVIDLGRSIAAQDGVKQDDLFYIDSVLVSVGWNRNDDVFDPRITWAARNTPIHKPFNLGHNEDDIIGHMIASFVQSGGKIVPDDTPEDEVPDVFDIIVSSVIYSKKQNPESQAKVSDLIEGIKNNDWCVSMECLFRDFDFALIGPDGTHRVVARDASTAHLTRHLRIFGGDGTYEGNKVGRLLKNFAFSGKGLVERPANPRSIIINNFRGSQASLEEVQEASASDVEDTKFEKEEENITMSEILQKQLDAAQARIAELEAGRDKDHDAQISAANEKIEAQSSTIEEQQTKIADLEAQIAQKNTEAEEVAETHATEIAAKDAQIETLEAEKTAAEAARVAEARTNMLVEAGIERDEAETKVEMFAALDDEAFAAYSEDMKKSKKGKDGEEDDMKDKKGKAEETDEEGESQADESVIENADVDDETGTVATSPADETDEVLHEAQAAFANWFKHTPVKEESK